MQNNSDTKAGKTNTDAGSAIETYAISPELIDAKIEEARQLRAEELARTYTALVAWLFGPREEGRAEGQATDANRA
ncbi:MAG: hypothetical protein AAFR79_02945 [Pseudomonadota bacterium]